MPVHSDRSMQTVLRKIRIHRFCYKEKAMQLKDPHLHQKLQEMCDCYLETDFAGQMRTMSGARPADLQEEAVKYLSLALMYGVTEKARKLTIKSKKGEIETRLKIADAKIKLPQPTENLFDAVIELVRGILHFERESGTSPLSLGLRNSLLDLLVKLKVNEKETSLKIQFPELGD